MTLIPNGQLVGRGSRDPPLRPRLQRSAPRVDGRMGCVAVDVRRGGGAEARCRKRSRGMATEINAPRGRPGGDVTAMGGVSVAHRHERRPGTAAAIGAQRGRPCGMCRHRQVSGRGSGGPPPRRMSALRAGSCGGTSLRTSGGEGGARPVAANNAAGLPRRTSPCANGRAGVSPQTIGEGRGSGGLSLRRSAPRANGRGGMSLRRPREGRSDSHPARKAAWVRMSLRTGTGVGQLTWPRDGQGD